MAGLSPNQIRLRTGGFRSKSGKIFGGMVLPKDIEKDRKAGIVEVVRKGRFGVTIKATKKGKKVLLERVKRKGFL